MKTEPVKPGEKVNLKDSYANETPYFDGSKEAAEPVIQSLNEQLEVLQELMYAENKNRLLIVLQAMDAGGKDGVVRHVFDGVNPQGVRVASFKVPSPEESAHDYLWRIHKETPKQGEIVIFNRSHYEDVLVGRVENLAPKSVWEKRYEHINHFEKMLADEGTTILKFYLHISKGEQCKRLLDRINKPEKQWKFNPGDLESRKKWDEYMAAYKDVLEKTSTEWAPWYIVPADRKWYRDLFISSVIVKTLDNMQMKPLKPKENLEPYRIQLEAEQ